MKQATAVGSLSGKVVASVLVLACVAIGIVGLVLPVIPGLLFLAIAAFVVARHVPAVDARLRRHRGIDEHMNRAEGFVRLSLPAKFQVAGWMCVKVLLDTVALIGSLLAKRRAR